MNIKVFCDKNAVAKSASIQKAKANLEIEFTEIQSGGEEGRLKKKKWKIISKCLLAIPTAPRAVD